MTIELSKEEKAEAVASLRRYWEENFGEPVGELAAGMLLGYFLEELGPAVYNRAIADAQSRLAAKLADLGGELYGEPFGYWPRQEAKRQKRR